MEYNEALGRWGAAKAGEDPNLWEQFSVDLEVNPGYACCGGRDEGCYCSYAESPSVELVIRHNGRTIYTDRYLDFTETVREIFEVANP